MPFDVKVSGISKDDGEVLFAVEPVWWDERKLRSNRRFTPIQINMRIFVSGCMNGRVVSSSTILLYTFV